MFFLFIFAFRWSLGNHENFALQIADATNFYITEKVWLCDFNSRQQYPRYKHASSAH